MDKKNIEKNNWVSRFTLIGEAKVNDYTFKIDEKSEKSNWIYNSINLGVDCGEKYGTVYCELFGGYNSEANTVVYAHGKDDDGKDDFNTRITIDWDDRMNPEILENVGDLCFITIGLEKTDKDKTFYKKFVSPYDAIAYVKNNIEDGMVVNVKGTLNYSMYNDTVQVRKTIKSIVLSKAETDKYRASFTQTILIDKDSASLKDIDKDKGVMYVNARVLDYVKEMNGKEIKGQFPFYKQFEFPMDFTKQDVCKKIMDKLFKVKKNSITQITFEGNLIEGGATVMATMDDVPDEIKELIEIGVYTEEEALARCSTNGNRERRMVLVRPTVNLVGDDKVPVLQIYQEQYTEDDLDMSWVFDGSDEDEDEVPFQDNMSNVGSTGGSEDSDMAWLESL